MPSYNVPHLATVLALACTAIALAGDAQTAAHACPVTWLARHYGITFSGFTTPIPAAEPPDVTNDDAFVRLPIPQPVSVNDGFRHTAVIDRRTKKAWILRTGGFIGVVEWYGPVDVDTTSLDSCVQQADPVRGGTRG